MLKGKDVRKVDTGHFIALCCLHNVVVVSVVAVVYAAFCDGFWFQ